MSDRWLNVGWPYSVEAIEQIREAVKRALDTIQDLDIQSMEKNPELSEEANRLRLMTFKLKFSEVMPQLFSPEYSDYRYFSGSENGDHRQNYYALYNRIVEIIQELSDYMFKNEEMLLGLKSSHGIVRYKQLESRLAREFGKLTTYEALSLFPKPSFAALCTAIGIYAVNYVSFFRQAFAADQAFVPPLGLSHSAFTAIVMLFAGLFSVLVLGLFYVGYIAKPRNQGAANAVAHLITFLSGALLGIRAG